MIDEYVKKWLTKANNDLKVAQIILQSPEGELVTEAVCFHAQQAAEKLLKAFLITKNIEFGKTHNLEYLLELCIKIDKDFQQVKIGNLTFYAIEVRYSDEFHVPTKGEAVASAEIARKIKEFILAKLNISEKDLI